MMQCTLNEKNVWRCWERLQRNSERKLRMPTRNTTKKRSQYTLTTFTTLSLENPFIFSIVFKIKSALQQNPICRQGSSLIKTKSKNWEKRIESDIGHMRYTFPWAQAQHLNSSIPIYISVLKPLFWPSWSAHSPQTHCWISSSVAELRSK